MTGEMGDISSMSNEQLRNELSTSGLGSIPAITSSTRKIYEKKLASLRAEKGKPPYRKSLLLSLTVHEFWDHLRWTPSQGDHLPGEGAIARTSS